MDPKHLVSVQYLTYLINWYKMVEDAQAEIKLRIAMASATFTK
jgi:hypothetical protein